ncbi:MAG: lasso peptide [Moorea sp. SIO4A3]|nr:lasso peptide [Moorena sp. SIO4A3]
MLKTYTTPEMIVHGSIEKLTEVSGRDKFQDFAFFNGEVVAESDDSQNLNCTNQGCV